MVYKKLLNYFPGRFAPVVCSVMSPVVWSLLGLLGRGSLDGEGAWFSSFKGGQI